MPAVPHIERNRLNRLLDAAARRRVCVVLAGPGWGKTTMLAAWLAGGRAAAAPIAPTSGDDIRRVLRSLGEAPHHAPVPARGVLGPGEGAEPGVDSPVQEVVLLLDDLQDLLGPAQLWGSVEELCRHAAYWLHLILISRQELPFSLQRLRGQGLVADIDAPRLAFEPAEVAALLEAVTGAAQPDLAAAVHEATGGWPAAVRMAVDALAGSAPATRDGVLAHLAGPGGRLGEYLAEEVFAGEPRAVRQLLRRIAVVHRITPALCDALGWSDATRGMPDLVRRGLLRFTPGAEPTWSVVPVVRRYLLDDPELPAAERVALHRRAADFYAGRRSYAVALRHLTAAEDRSAIASLLAEHGTRLVDTGQADSVLAAADLATPGGHDQRVRQVVGYARHVRGQWAGALEAFQNAGADEDEFCPGLAWRMGLIRYGRGEVDLAQEVYRRGRLRREDTVDEVLLLSWMAAAYHLAGDFDRCRATVDRAVAAAERCRQSIAWAFLDTVRAQLAASEGDRAAAGAYFRSAMRWAEAAENLLQMVRIAVNRAGHLIDMGLLEEALRQVEAALRWNETCGYAAMQGAALNMRGFARALQGDLDAALADFRTAAEMLQAIGSRYLAQSLTGLGYVYRQRGELTRARTAYEDASAQAESCHDLRCLGAALAGLARVRAADDPAAARALADRAVGLGTGPTLVHALNARGWVTLLAGDSGAAADDAVRAVSVARMRQDRPGLAEALVLAAMASRGRQEGVPLLSEAAQIWAELGYRLEEAQARLVAARMAGPRSAAELAEQALGRHGVCTDGPHAAGALAVLGRSAPSISIHSLGVFRVVRDGEPVPAAVWRSKKARILLKILVARRGRPVSREQLTDLLWPDEDPGTASRRLSVLLSTVRGVLGAPHQSLEEGPIVTDRDVVWLDLAHLDVDVEHFLAVATGALEAHAQDLPPATPQLAAAEAAYTGDFLEDDPYEEWAGALRDEARAVYAAVLRALVQRLHAAEDVDRSLRYSLRLLQCDEYEEAAHLDLVRALLRSGRRGEARRRYHEYVRRMTEIGVPPQAFPDPGGTDPPAVLPTVPLPRSPGSA